MEKYVFEYSEHMKNYREKENITTGVVRVELKDKRQLKNKFPKFKLTFDFMVRDGLLDEKYKENTVKTTPMCDGSFVVQGGWGQISGGVIRKVSDL